MTISVIATPSLYQEQEKEKLFFSVFLSQSLSPPNSHAEGHKWINLFSRMPQDLYHKPVTFRQYLHAMVLLFYSVPYEK